MPAHAFGRDADSGKRIGRLLEDYWIDVEIGATRVVECMQIRSAAFHDPGLGEKFPCYYARDFCITCGSGLSVLEWFFETRDRELSV